MLRCETNTPSMAREIELAFEEWSNEGNWVDQEKEVRASQLSVDFEHGQWWVTHRPTGAQWAVNDAVIDGRESWDFEQISEGTLE